MTYFIHAQLQKERETKTTLNYPNFLSLTLMAALSSMASWSAFLRAFSFSILSSTTTCSYSLYWNFFYKILLSKLTGMLPCKQREKEREITLNLDNPIAMSLNLLWLHVNAIKHLNFLNDLQAFTLPWTLIQINMRERERERERERISPS